MIKRAFVTGFPIRHSRSPLIHGYWLREHGLEGAYEAVEVAPGDFAAFIDRLRSGESGFVGGNVTIPHKEVAVALADSADASAARLGAANTLWLENGILRAANTDGYGFLASLDAARPGWDGASGGTPRRAVVLGAGGASRAIIGALGERGFEAVHVVNRTEQRAAALAALFGGGVTAHAIDALPAVMEGAALFVNTSAMGMHGETVPDIDFTALAPDAVVTDIVYTPLKTPILVMAERDGRATVDGLGMLLHQAVPGFERWFGVRPQVTPELRALIVADLEKAG